MKKYIIFFSLFVIGIIILVAYSAIISRHRHDDAIKSTDINSIKYAIDGYASKNNQLPVSLETIDFKCEQFYSSNRPDIFGGTTSKSDCVADRLKNYKYENMTSTKYELCSDFALNTAGRASQNNNEKYNRSSDSDAYVDTGLHPAGAHCFEYSVKLDNASFYQDNLKNNNPVKIYQTPGVIAD